MKINKLILENFQGVKNAEFDFNGLSSSIYGDNATGKTTVFNAVTWLLFDKPSTGAKGFTPKTNNEKGGTYHHLNHSAEAIFTLENGRRITLKKIFHEVYKKKRGSAFEELDGHTIDYFIDGVPTGTEKEYINTVLSFCDNDSEKMKILTMPNYFPEVMSWDSRRKILLDVCGDISDEFVILNTPEISELNSFLLMPGTSDQFYSVDEYKKIAGAKKTEINKQLQDIPGRIDEVQRAIPNIDDIDISSLDNKIKQLAQQKSQLEVEKSELINNDNQFNAIRKQISDARLRLSESKARHIESENKINEGFYAEISQLKSEIREISNKTSDIDYLLKKAQRNLIDMQAIRSNLLDEYNKIQAETWNESLEICPTCHQSLPENEICNLREEFNLNKGKKLESINARGQKEASKDMIEKEISQINEYQEQLNILNNEREGLETQERTIKSKLHNPVEFETTEVFHNIMGEIMAFEEKENLTSNHYLSLTKVFDEKITVIQDEINKYEKMKGNIYQAEMLNRRIFELEKQEKELSAQYEKIEHGVYLCECFIRAKVSLLTQRINDKFENVSFRLFIEQQNGGIKEDCEVMVPKNGRMVPYAYANNAARINAGLEIINTLSNHWGLEMPVFIDNAESVTKLQKMDTQVVRLVVSEYDKELRLEIQ